MPLQRFYRIKAQGLENEKRPIESCVSQRTGSKMQDCSDPAYRDKPNCEYLKVTSICWLSADLCEMNIWSQSMAQEERVIQKQPTVLEPSSVLYKVFFCAHFNTGSASQYYLSVTFSSKAPAEQQQSSRKDIQGWIQPCWHWGMPNS